MFAISMWQVSFFRLIFTFDLLRDELIKDNTGKLAKTQQWVLASGNTLPLTSEGVESHARIEAEVSQQFPEVKNHADYYQSVLKQAFQYRHWLKPTVNSYRKLLKIESGASSLLISADNVYNSELARSLKKWNNMINTTHSTCCEPHQCQKLTDKVSGQVNEMIIYVTTNETPSNITCPTDGHHLTEDDICNGVLDCQQDAWDELECETCPKGRSNHCGVAESKCIEDNQICNGRADCLNGSDEKNCRYLLSVDGLTYVESDFYVDNEQFHVEFNLSSLIDHFKQGTKNSRMTLKNMNRLFFGKQLSHKRLEFASTFNMVRFPITSGPEAFFMLTQKQNPSLIDFCANAEFNPPADAFYCERLTMDMIKLPAVLEEKCSRKVNFLTQQSLCDGYQDCRGGEDERVEFCHAFDCGPNRWKCYRGPSFQCIHKDSVCDGISNCENSEDELESCIADKQWLTGQVRLLLSLVLYLFFNSPTTYQKPWQTLSVCLCVFSVVTTMKSCLTRNGIAIDLFSTSKLLCHARSRCSSNSSARMS